MALSSTQCNNRLVEKAVLGGPPLPLSESAIPLNRTSALHDAYFNTAERFVGHSGPVIFVGFTPAFLLVTADRAGNIMAWPYEKGHFTGFNWYQPGGKVSLNLDYTFEPVLSAPTTTVFPPPGLLTPANPLFDPEYLLAVEQATANAAALPETHAPPAASRVTPTGNMLLTYAPVKISDSQTEVECTVLEYGASGAGAGLLVRHATQQCRTDRSSRGALEAAGFSRSRRELLVMLSTQGSKGVPSTLAVVGLKVETMEWLPLRIDLGRAGGDDSPGSMVVGPHRLLLGRCLSLRFHGADSAAFSFADEALWTSQHGLSSITMALITSDCDTPRSQCIKWP